MSGVALVVGALAVALACRRPMPRQSTPHSARVVRRDRRTGGAADWAVLLDSIAAGVRAGHSLHESFDRALATGRPQGRAITASSRLLDVPHLASVDADEAVVLQTMSVALSLGGPTAAVLQSGATLLRERATVRAEAAAHAAQARLSAKVMTAVPIVFATWGAASSPSFRHSLLHPFGAFAASVGLLLNGVGWWWMRRVVRRATP